MTKTFYSAANLLMREHQDVVNDLTSEEIPTEIVSIEGMSEYVKSQGGILFLPTTSIRDYCVVDDEDMVRIGEIIKANATTSFAMKAEEAKGPERLKFEAWHQDQVENHELQYVSITPNMEMEAGDVTTEEIYRELNEWNSIMDDPERKPKPWIEVTL